MAKTITIRSKVFSCFVPLSVYSAVLLDGVFRGLLDRCYGFSDWFAAPHYLTYPGSGALHDRNELLFVLH
jgi:hypothetical protein